LIATLVWLVVPIASADDMSDPMQPLFSGSGGVAQKASGARWVVTGILISPERRLAMINDRLIGIGEKVDGARVRAIRGNGVELDVNGRLIFLKHETDSVRLSEKENQ
jgi:MSHA biogenesis protein MshK